MRVALVSPYDLDVVGGVQSHVTALAEALRALGDEVVVVGPGDPERSDEGTLRIGHSLRVPANGSRAPIALTPRAVAATRAVLSRLRPDVVQVHEPLVPLVGPAAALRAGVPTVLTFHASADGGALPVLARAVRPLGRAVLRGASALTAVSPHAAAFHARALGIDPRRMSVIPNGVDVARFAAPARRIDPSAPTLLFLGRLEPRKGADLALEAFARLAVERPTLRLRIVGAGPQEGSLRRRLAGLPPQIAARVEMVGRVPQSALPEVLAAADVALVPSRGGESFGIVLLELMAAGTPIVASDLAAYRDVARPDREALLVRPGDTVALAAAAAQLLDDAEAAGRLAGTGRRRAQEFAWPAVAARVRAVLAAAAGGGAGPSGRRAPRG